MNQRLYWYETTLLISLPLLALLFVPSLSNAFLIKQPLAAFFIALALILAALQTRLSYSTSPFLLWGSLIYMASALWSAAFASNPTQAWQDCLLQFLLLSLFLLGAMGGYSKNFSKKSGQILVICSVGISLLGIVQWFFPDQLNFDLQALGKMKVFSTLGNPNYVACYLLPVFPLAFYLFQQETSKFRRAFWVIAGLLALICLILTDSRSGWLALAFGLLVGIFLRVKQEKVRWIIGLGLAAIWIIAFWVGFSTHTGQGRFMIWAESMDIWEHHPFGVGWENFNIHQLEAQKDFFQTPAHVQNYQHNAAFVFDAHNEALNTFVEIGPLGFLGWMLLITITIWKGYHRAQENVIYQSWYMGWMSMLFFSLWSAILFYTPLALIFWIGSGILVSPLPRSTARTNPLVIRIGVILTASVILLYTCVWGVRDTRAAYWEHQGDILLATGPFDRDVDFFRQSLALNPANGFVLQKMGLALYFNNQYDEALDKLHQAKPLYGDIAVPYLEAEILARQHHYPEAIAIYQFISGAFPDHVTPPFMMGQIYLKLGDKEKAKAQLQRVLDIEESPFNLRLDREKIQRQKELAAQMLKAYF